MTAQDVMISSDSTVLHPVQVRACKHPCVNAAITKRAYEVYCKLFGKQDTLVTGNCCGGFAATELVAFLYARSFPECEWGVRLDEALNGINL